MIPKGTALPALVLAAFAVSVGPSQATAGSAASLEQVAGGFDVLSNAVRSPADPRMIYVVEQYTGRVRLVDDGRVAERPVLDLGDRLIAQANFEEGLLSVALADDDPADLYASYVGRDGTLVVSRFALAEDGRRADPESERVLLRVERDQRMHHCGHLAFGPHDGLLYVCVGDTQDNLEIEPVSQDPGRLQGKILRLDPGASTPVARGGDGIIGSAQAATVADRPEVWLSGLRNPWRFGFDPTGERIFVPDVGRNHWEELNVLPTNRAGGNFGWPLAEAGECLTDCTLRDDLIWPVFEYVQSAERCSIIGGVVHNGSRKRGWRGAYLFADLCSGEIWAWRDDAGAAEVTLIADTDLVPVAILSGSDGEPLIVDGPNGALWRLDLPAADEAAWRPATTVMGEALLEPRRAGNSRTRELLEDEREALHYMRASKRWRLTQPLVDLYDALGRPFD